LRHPTVGTCVTRGNRKGDVQRARRVAPRYVACFRLISSRIGRRFHERPAQQEARGSRRHVGPEGTWINDGRAWDRWAVLQSALEGVQPACRSGRLLCPLMSLGRPLSRDGMARWSRTSWQSQPRVASTKCSLSQE
jgi:hypothetical protein